MQLDPDKLVSGGDLSDKGHYLATHLIDILKHGSGGKHSPRAWLYRKDDGSLAHTFNFAIAEGRDSWGGTDIPMNCLSSDQKGIFTQASDVIKQYIKSFSLGDKEIDAVYACLPV